jgi:cobalt-zinc-cadmium efflux system membrane fusion protein
MRVHRLFLWLAMFLAAGCERQEASRVEASASTRPTAAPASAGLCEHGVLQSVCPKCKPALAAVFQAKGDWCGEHGFPESFCPICHPEQGGKPKSDVSGDGAPPDGTKVRFKNREVATHAGIEVVKAERREAASSVTALARLAYDATKLAQLNARSPGVVRALAVDVGAHVKQGQAIATIDSAEIASDRSRLVAASARVELADQNLKRTEQLAQEGISSEKQRLEARQELEQARSERTAISAALSAMGASGGSAGSYRLVAPIAGTVTERRATIGKLVDPSEILFEIVDTSALWAEVDIPEDDLGRVATGQEITLVLDSLPDRKFTARIDYLAPAIDPHTRTARARAAISNTDGALRAHMFGQAKIAVTSPESVVSVPRNAVQKVKAVRLVFVRLGEDLFEARRVTLGVEDGAFVEVTRGLKPGEEVVTTGAFLLKTETLKDSIGAGCCDTD